ncbi:MULTISPECIES: hypothetical protein [unclassified Streptomyces]|uniref:hypothetical protein n=1 Tax=unclassified Streptomyces TaxID=2593676 RepID=UPI003413DF6C
MSNQHRKQLSGPLLPALSVVAAGALLVGCSSDSGSNDAFTGKQGSTPSSSSSSSSSSGTGSAGVAYAKCMREHGVPNFPDPEQDAGGGVKLVVPEGVDPNSPTFTSAQSACQDLLYQGDTGDGAGSRAFDATKVAAWAKCIREHGLPNFPDPVVDGNTIVIDADAAGLSGRDDPKFSKATQACYSIRPGGSLFVRNGAQP